jgi:hypothetical protein
LTACGSRLHTSSYADKCVPDSSLVAASDNGRYVAVRRVQPWVGEHDVWIDREVCAEVP